MSIRMAVRKDVPILLRLTKEFAKKYHPVPLNSTKAKATITGLVNTGVVLVNDTPSGIDGFIAGVLYDDPFRDTTVLTEIGWYSEGKSGAKLLLAFIKAGRDKQADIVAMGTLESSPKIAEDVLTRVGFTKAESTWTRNL